MNTNNHPNNEHNVKALIIGSEKMIESLRELIDINETFKERDNLSPDLIKFNTEFSIILNFSSLVVISTLDLHIIYKHLLLSKFESGQKFFIRSGSLIIYETLNTYKKYQKELLDIFNTNRFVITLVGESIRDFKKKYNLTEIRNKASAHIDKNYKDYYSVTSKINVEDSRIMILEFLTLLNKMTSIYNNFIIKAKRLYSNTTNQSKNQNEEQLMKRLRQEALRLDILSQKKED